jgi:lipoprotein-anchoring transpeptidase ErfK/SrfK
MGGTVPGLLLMATVVAVFGGLFASTDPGPAVASIAGARAQNLPSLPEASGQGRRVVFDQSEQRVWLVDADGEIRRTYLVTGSNRDNVQPGSYVVQSRTRHARAYTGSGTFEFFVKFTDGRNAPIGFHTITANARGRLVYAREDLGTPRTPGCVEQWLDDAKALWAFAPVGTPVEVTA